MQRQLIHSLFLLAALAGSAQAQEQVVALRPLGNGTAELVACNLTDGRPLPGGPLETGLILIDAELNGISALEALDPASGRSEALPGGGRVIRLPLDQGSLYLMRRESDATRFGWWHVKPDGHVRLLVERPGTGTLGDQNPFVARCAATPDGRRLLLGTTLEGGGDLLTMQLDTVGPVRNRTRQLPPLDLRPESLLHGPAFGVATHALGALVLPQDDGAQALRVQWTGGTPNWISSATVLSPQGLRAAVIAGDSELASHAWVLDEGGSASCANPQPMQMSGAGHFPEAVNGPWLAVSDEGTRCAWRSMELTSECYTARLDTAQPLVEHVTQNAQFIDTLGEAGVLGFLTPDRLLIGVGEPQPGGGFGRLDLFEQHFAANGTTTLRNLSATSGQTAPPFTLPPAIESMQIMRTASSDRVLIYDDQGSNGRLLVVQAGVSGASVALDNVRELDWVRRVGDELWFSAERDFGASRPRHIFRADGGLTTTPTILVAGGEDMLFESPVIGSDWIAFRRELELGPVTLERAYVDGTHEVLIPATIPIANGPVILPSDHLGAIAVNANGPRGIVIRPDAPRGWLLRTPVPTGSFLLGN